MDLQTMYSHRFERAGIERRKRVWRILCRDYFNALIDPSATVLDLACGYGEFINNVAASRKLAIDLNPDAAKNLDPSVTFFLGSATDLDMIGDASVDVVFTSNFLEHLPSKEACSQLFLSVKRILKPSGRFLVLGPNIRYAHKEYWDFYDHHLPLSHLSLEEGLRQQGFDVVRNIPRFLPYTMNSGIPTPGFLVRAYLRLPIFWSLLGKQFFLIAEKPADVENRPLPAEPGGRFRFARFLAVGGFAAAVNLAARVLFSEFMSYELAIVLAFPIALTTAFLLNRRYVFPEAGSDSTGQYLRFALVNLAALAQVWIVSVGLARFILPAISWEWHTELIAHAVGVCSPVLTSYYAHKWFTFRPA